jgi:hypothetical protein
MKAHYDSPEDFYGFLAGNYLWLNLLASVK